MKNYDMRVLIKECEDLLAYVEQQELDNDCQPIEQTLINTVANVLFTIDILKGE